MKKTRLLTVLLMAVAIGMGCTSCDKEDDNTGNDNSPEDLTGIEVNLRNANGGYVVVLDNYVWLEIDKSDNFVVDKGASIVSVGQVPGLSKVTNIPNSGWSYKVIVKKGHGYIIRNSTQNHYARVYVVDMMTDASSGGVIGATIRYEPDWK